MTEPIKAADSGLFNATGKGDLKIGLPNFPGNKPITIILQGVYYLSNIAFILISVSCLDCASCSVLFENGSCTIHRACPEQKFLS